MSNIPIIRDQMQARLQLATIWAQLNAPAIDPDIQMMNRLMRSIYMRLGGDPDTVTPGGPSKELGRLALAGDLAATAVEVCAGKVKDFESKEFLEALELTASVMSEAGPLSSPDEWERFEAAHERVKTLLRQHAIHVADIPHKKEG